jgi:CBS domain-containing protein
MARRYANETTQQIEGIRSGDTVEHAVRAVLDSGLPALPVVDDAERLTGIFGEREFFHALFPRYFDVLPSAEFVRHTLDDALEHRATCRHERVAEHMNTEHVEVRVDASDAQVAETFLHHRVLILPVVDDGRLAGVITRGDFFTSLALAFLGD